MFNLLPESLKVGIKSEYRLRIVIVSLLAFIFIQVSFVVFILPSWMMSTYKEKEAVIAEEEQNQSKITTSLNTITATIADTNTKLNIISSALEYKKVLPFLNATLSSKTAAIKLHDFSYEYVSPGEARIVVNGTSNTRDNLVSYVNILQNTKQFKKVDLPISNLTKDKNIDFSITLTISS